MSELREWTASEIEEYDDARLELSEDGKVSCTKLYIKSEADKVIEELKADYQEACGRLQTANLIKDEQLAATRHSKYKRCLAMAERCKYRMYYLAAVVEQEASKIIPLKEQIRWYEKRERRMDYWKNRWLELAEKFKEGI